MERLGGEAVLTLRAGDGPTRTVTAPLRDHRAAVEYLIAWLVGPEGGAGLGGRAITKASLNRTLREAVADLLQPLTFMDLDWRIVNRQLDREALMRRSGPTAENILRDVGPIAAKVA